MALYVSKAAEIDRQVLAYSSKPFSVNFEDELAIMHEENAIVVGIEMTAESYEQEQNTVEMYKDVNSVSERFLPYDNTFIE